MVDKTTQEAKDHLLRMRREVMQEVQDAAAACRELGQDGVPDIGDMSSHTYSRDVLLRITSYNVCYTKLLRVSVLLSSIDITPLPLGS